MKTPDKILLEQQFLNRFSAYLEGDSEAMWEWQDDIAQIMVDEGVKPLAANQRVAEFLANKLGVDPRKTPQWVKRLEGWVRKDS